MANSTASEPAYDKMPYHLRLRKEEVGETAIIVGDPGRVEKVAAHMKDAKRIGSNREYLTYSGYIGGKRAIVMSTGIGCPAAAIAIEELARLGVKTIVRVGTCGSINKNLGPGNLVIAEASVRLDGTTKQYVPMGYPAAATPELTVDLKAAASASRKKFMSGIAAATDAFYVGQGRKGFGGYETDYSKNIMGDMMAAKVLCFEMETSVLFILGRLYDLNTGAVLAVIANRITDEFKPEAGVEDAIKVAIDGIKRFQER